jgi:hypothetical protein
MAFASLSHGWELTLSGSHGGQDEDVVHAEQGLMGADGEKSAGI